ncbi:Cobalt-zinc-cadmium resistance protein CzcC precursor [Rubripirellula obstinata]|uniref:Cobalt-zinc-cadmium resistance protein CzcC n=2 Tax=Rubripirellula obstinata TaxID=406547 RepID=A0A5B1CES0_9BACT|nr:Cobalt-zinc-cadmium resistance protein CzcC precursor [Rubripirellula obstinata]
MNRLPTQMDLNMSTQRRLRHVLAAALVAITSGTATAQQPITDSQMIESDSPTLNNPMPPTSPEDLRARVGEKFTEPPPVPPVPQSLTESVYTSAEAPLTLQTIESIACSRNPTLAQAQAQIQSQLGKAIQAGLVPNPNLMYVGEQVGIGGTAGEWQGAVFQQRIVTARKLQLSRAKFLQLTRSAEWRALEQQYQVLNDLRIQFWTTLGHQQLVELHNEILKNAEDAVVTSRELYNAGQATRADMHKANIMLQRARLDVLMIRNQLKSNWYELAAIAGTRQTPTPLTGALEGPVELIDFDIALDRLISESPQILAARSKLQADEIKVKRETVEPIPDVVVSYGYGRNFEARDNSHGLGLQVEVPLYDWNQGTIRQAEADVVRQQGEIQRIEFTLQRQLAKTYQSYLTAVQNVRSYQEVMVPEAKQAYEVLLDAYEEDRVAWPLVLEAQVEYYRLRTQYVQHLIAWRSNETLIAGYLLNGGLMPPTGPQPPGHISAVPKPR